MPYAFILAGHGKIAENSIAIPIVLAFLLNYVAIARTLNNSFDEG